MTCVATNKNVPPEKTNARPVHHPIPPFPPSTSTPTSIKRPYVVKAPKGAASEKAKRDFRRNEGVTVGFEERREDSAKAAGALCTMMARKMMSSNELEELDVSEDEGAAAAATVCSPEGSELAPRDTPSAREWTTRPITVDIADEEEEEEEEEGTDPFVGEGG
ncbi:BQ2448_5046 [Microbotryum intermedium]|uniref:BQ2448_5046 protein n=1 Tax=Microbotryum intermedium TaxID=269621 RepID=A0A238F343_9BASI|nr:BQ2448_5046 [Microbotryum intermedium]